MKGKTVDELTMQEVLAIEGEIRAVPEYPHCYVARSGNVYAYRRYRGQIRDGLIQVTVGYHTGYPVVQLTVGKREIAHALVHRLVAQAYLPDKLYPDAQVGFKDNDPTNCDVSNLYWHVDKRRLQVMDRRARGFSGSAHKLTDKDIDEIKERLSNGEFGSQIARDYDVSEAMISRIKNGSRHS